MGRELVPAVALSELFRVVPEHTVLLEEVVDRRGPLGVKPSRDGVEQESQALEGGDGRSSYL